MSSLSARLLVSVSVLLLLFFGATIIVLDTAFVSAGERAREEILDGYLMQLLAAAEPDAGDGLQLPPDLVEARFNTIGSGLYGQLQGADGQVEWQSRSALGLTLPVGPTPAPGAEEFFRVTLGDGTPLLALSLAVRWEFEPGDLRAYVFRVYESMDAFNAQVAAFRRQLFGWFAAVAAIMLLAIAVLMRGLLRPLRQIEEEISEIEEGGRTSLSAHFPTELSGVARNMNLLIDSERARSERYRNTLDNLAHSLKTPLAAIRALAGEPESGGARQKLDEQIERMDDIIRYQLRKPAHGGGRLVRSAVAVEEELEKLVASLRKVYHDKSPEIALEVAGDAGFSGDNGDFLELAGNLVDNACKWCDRRVNVSVQPAEADAGNASGMVFTVDDDGPGIPADAADLLLQRGMRLDESAPGHGIGLSIVRDIAHSYGGHVTIARSPLGGARVSVRIPSAAG
jgi:two-component system sensor histidine kinase PhoQ